MEVEELVIQAMSVRQLKLLVAEANLAHLLPNAVEREDLRTLALQVRLWELEQSCTARCGSRPRSLTGNPSYF